MKEGRDEQIDDGSVCLNRISKAGEKSYPMALTNIDWSVNKIQTHTNTNTRKIDTGT